MSTLIVGGDRVSSYRGHLERLGLAPVAHWSGRRYSECHRHVPQETRLIVVLVDQVNHGLTMRIRKLADERNLPIVFSCRGIGQLDTALLRSGIVATNA